MIAEILLVPGVDGDDLKSSAQYVGRGLSSVGVKVREQINLCSDTLKLQQAIAAGLGRSNILVILGGMGRRNGFVSKNVISQGLNLPLEANRECLAAIQAYCKKSGEPFEVDDLDLASLPRGAKPFPPSYGKIPGCIISSSKQHIVLLPEVQQEISPMFNHYVVPSLGGAQSNSTVTRTLRTYGMKEDTVRDMLSDLTAAANPMVTVQKEGNEVLVRVTAHAASNHQAAALCTPVLRTMVDRLGDAAYGLDVDSLQAAVIQKMDRKSLELGVAEAGLDGMLTRLLGETEGGQEVLRYSVSADDDAVKTEKLGARAKLLKKRGSVSEYAAVAMAAGAMEKTDTGGIGVGAVANTVQDSKKCPMGLVYIAVCDEEHVYVKKLIVGDGNVSADTVIDAAVSRALNMIRLFVDYVPEKYPGAIPLESALKGKKTVTDSDSYDDALEEEQYADESSGGGSGGFVRKAIFTIAILIFLGCAGYLGKMGWDSYTAAKLATELQNMFEYGEMGDVDLTNYPSNYLVKFAGLWSMNPDVVAFVNIPDTTVKYPIVQADDNDYYLRRDFNGNGSQHGIPFMDYRVDVKKPSTNMVIYGHNMKDGQIFGELMSYKDFQYYQDHPVVELATVYEENKYKIFSVFITNAYEAQGPVFAYHDFIEAASGDDFLNYVNQIKVRSLFNTTVDVQPGDQLITLSSCTYEFQDARLVVVARKLRSGETEEVNTADATVNPNPLYPDIWYQVFGGTKPQFNTMDIVTSPTTNAITEDSSLPVENLAAGDNWVADRALLESEVEAVKETAQAPLPISTLESKVSVAAVNSNMKSEREEERLESEAQLLLASQLEASRLASELEVSRLASEAAASSQAAIAAEARRLASEAEASRLAAEAETSRLAAQKSSSISEMVSYVAKTDDEDVVDTDRNVTVSGAESNKNNATATLPSGSLSNKSGQAMPGSMTVYLNGTKVSLEPFELVSRVVQNEVGTGFHTEAIKAQAVASYTYMLYEINTGKVPSVYANSSVSAKVSNAVAEVIGQQIYYNEKTAFTPYHATSAGQTTSSKDVWGGSYPYLVSVDSSIEQSVTNYKYNLTMSSDEVENRIYSKLGIDVSGHPSSWFEVLDYAEGGYNGKMAICGNTKSAKTGSVLTGRLIRETVLNLRSAYFSVDYDDNTDNFTFTTYGYGHGVGMPQNGANLRANEGWNYIQILQYYYPGTEIY